MKVLVFGGSGFVGQQLLKTFQAQGWQTISVSRHGRPKKGQAAWTDEVTWVKSDVTKDQTWQDVAKNADWIIDAIGILFEKPKQGITYENAIVLPLQNIADFLLKQSKPARLIFISANKAPLVLKKYMQHKIAAERFLQQPDFAKLQSVIIYPGLVIDAAKPSTLIAEWGIHLLYRLPFLKKWISGYLPIKRTILADEITKVMRGGKSILTQRRP